MFADTPSPPYLAVIFYSRRGGQDEGYAETAARMESLVQQQAGYLGMEAVHDEQGNGITISYWRDEESAQAWRAHAEHAIARARGNAEWYDAWSLRVANVERDARFERET